MGHKTESKEPGTIQSHRQHGTQNRAKNRGQSKVTGSMRHKTESEDKKKESKTTTPNINIMGNTDPTKKPGVNPGRQT